MLIKKKCALRKMTNSIRILNMLLILNLTNQIKMKAKFLNQFNTMSIIKLQQLKKKIQKTGLLIFISLLCLNPLFTFAGEIPFEKGTMEEVFKKARASNKLIFIDAFTTWCGPCKWMAKNVFTVDEVGDFYGSNFICVKLDMEKGEGIPFAEKYDVHAYPTFLFLDGEGKKIHQVCGSKEVSAFLEDGKNAMTPEFRLYDFKTNYENGIRDFIFLKGYAQVLVNANINAELVINDLINSDAASELVNEKDFDLISSSASLESSSFSFIMNYREKYQSIIEQKKMNDFINGVFLTEAVKAAKNKTPDKLAEAQQKAEDFKLENIKELSSRMAWQYAQVTKEELYPAAQSYIENFALNDANELNNAAWVIFENYKETDQLEHAARWAKQSIELKKDFANTDTYANILHKIGNNEEALQVAKESIELGKKEEQDVESTQNLIKEIEDSIKSKK